ncbi:peptidoglycan DD-metalloendopeptidase family protein, partial [Priestia megaterium]
SRSYYSNTYGQVVFIKQTNGYETVYAHLDERFVTEGNSVAAGQNIGRVGNTGRSSGAHLHFEVHQGIWNPGKTNAVNPLAKLDKQKLSAYVKSDLAATVFQQLHSAPDNCILIHQGDTLSELAAKYEVDVEQLRKWNHLENTALNAGQVLKISP